MKWFSLLSLVALWVACKDPKTPVDEVVVVDASSDAGVSDASSDAGVMLPEEENSVEMRCGNACAQLARLGCPEAQPNPTGDSCVALCVKVERSKKMTLKPDCIAKANTIKELVACKTVRCLPGSAQ